MSDRNLSQDSLRSTDCKVIQGMEVVGVMNARLRFDLPGTVSFQGCKTVPLPSPTKREATSH